MDLHQQDESQCNHDEHSHGQWQRKWYGSYRYRVRYSRCNSTVVVTPTIPSGEVVTPTITGGEVVTPTVTGGEVVIPTITGGEVVTRTVTGGQIPKTSTPLYELLFIGAVLTLVGAVGWRSRKRYE